VPADGGVGVPAVDDEIVALGLARDGVADRLVEQGVVG